MSSGMRTLGSGDLILHEIWGLLTFGDFLKVEMKEKREVKKKNERITLPSRNT